MLSIVTYIEVLLVFQLLGLRVFLSRMAPHALRFSCTRPLFTKSDNRELKCLTSSLPASNYIKLPRITLPGSQLNVSKRCRAHGSQRISMQGEEESRSLEALEFDVVVVGAGIIGLTIANRILDETKFSVAVVDAKQPCAGATGAGQGYIWMNHRTPASKTWSLACRSKLLWEELVADLSNSGADPLYSIGWQNTGSLLLASTVEQAHVLQAHVEALATAGVNVEYLTSSKLNKVEPLIAVGNEGGAAFVPGDSQIDAALAVALIRQRNNLYRAQGRYKELLEAPVQRLLCSSIDGHLEVVQTSTHELHCRESVVMAAGAWSASILAGVADELSLPLIPPVKPRKGHLLVLEGLPHLKLNHGLMEFEYLANYKEVSSPQHSQPLDILVSSEVSVAPQCEDFGIAMTATMDTCGRLLLGSSREFSGFDITHQNGALECILERAAKFLPGLAGVSLQEALKEGRIRTGLRPYVPGGVPLIGPVPGLQGLLLATGHEGSGLCLALGTAEMVVAMLVGKQLPTNSHVYSPAGRLSC